MQQTCRADIRGIKNVDKSHTSYRSSPEAAGAPGDSCVLYVPRDPVRLGDAHVTDMLVASHSRELQNCRVHENLHERRASHVRVPLQFESSRQTLLAVDGAERFLEWRPALSRVVRPSRRRDTCERIAQNEAIPGAGLTSLPVAEPHNARSAQQTSGSNSKGRDPMGRTGEAGTKSGEDNVGSQTDGARDRELHFRPMSRCLTCHSTAILKTQVPGSAIQWFTCHTCKHAWCRVDGERVDPPLPDTPQGSDSSPNS